MVTIQIPDAIDLYRQSLYEKGLSENTLKGYSSDVSMFFEELELMCCEAADLPTLTMAWVAKSKADKREPKTIRRRVTAMRQFALMFGVPNLLVGHKLPPIGQQIPHPLPGLNKDLQEMLDLCQTDSQEALVALCGLLGLRLFEALGTRIEDFNLQTMKLRVWGKNNKVRFLPISQRAWRHLNARYTNILLGGGKFLIDYSDRGGRNFITELGRKAGVSRPIASHDLRSTFATLSWAKSKDIMALRYLLGHESIETTRMYVEVAEEALREAGDI